MYWNVILSKYKCNITSTLGTMYYKSNYEIKMYITTVFNRMDKTKKLKHIVHRINDFARKVETSKNRN